MEKKLNNKYPIFLSKKYLLLQIQLLRKYILIILKISYRLNLIVKVYYYCNSLLEKYLKIKLLK